MQGKGQRDKEGGGKVKGRRVKRKRGGEGNKEERRG